MISNHKFSLISVSVLYTNFSPFSFMYLTLYFSLMFFLFCSDNFIIFWLVIELITLLLIGICFSIFTNSFSYLIIYFLVQSVSSFSLLIFYTIEFYYFFILFLLLKLSMFPFHSWYVNVVYRFPIFPLFLVSTFHNIPSFLIIPFFYISLSNFIYFSLPLTILVSSFYMFSSSDLRLLLVSSSIGNNSWFFLSTLVSVDFFLLYLFIYSLNLYLVLISFSPLSSLSYSSHWSNNILSFFILLVSLSGIPPFPIFFLNVFTVYVLSSFLPFSIFFSLFFTFLIVSSYVISTFNLFSFRYSNHLFISF